MQNFSQSKGSSFPMLSPRIVHRSHAVNVYGINPVNLHSWRCH